MKKDLSKKVTLSILVGSMLFANSYALAADDKIGQDASDKTSNTETVTDGTVLVESGQEWREVIATVTGGANAEGNVATMTGGTVEFIGGAATDYGNGEGGAVIENGVVMSGGTAKAVVGAETYSGGAVTGNYVQMSENAQAQNVYGGITTTGNASGNYVTISGNAQVTGTETGSESEYSANKGVYGAYSYVDPDIPTDEQQQLGALENNTVTIEGGTVANAYGAYSEGNSNLTGNKVIVTGGQTGDVNEDTELIGGYSQEGSVKDGEVNISNSTTSAMLVGGYSGYTGTPTDEIVVSGNKVLVNKVIVEAGSKETYDIYGGLGTTAAISGNRVDITDLTITRTGDTAGKEDIIAAGANGFDTEGGGAVGAVNNNILTVNGTLKATNLYLFGGYIDWATGDATGNEVHIGTAGSEAQTVIDINGDDDSIIYGAYTEGAGNANENKVYVNNAEVEVDLITGGYSQDGSVKGNIVEVNDTTTTASIFGGYTDYDGTPNEEIVASGNKVTISNVTVSAGYNNTFDIYGGIGTTAAMTGNEVNITDLTINAKDDSTNVDVFIAAGANGFDPEDVVNEDEVGEVSGNILRINGELSGKNLYLYGGYIDYATGDATGNQIIIGSADGEKTTVTDTSDYQTSGHIYGGYTEGAGAASDNKITITNADVTAHEITGGDSWEGNADNNIVTVNDSKLTGQYIFGGTSEAGSGTANNNIVTISNVEMHDTSNYGIDISGGEAEMGSASGNKVTIENLTITRDETNDYTEDNIAAGANGGHTDEGNVAVASENTLTIKGSLTGYNMYLYGGYSDNGNGAATNNNVIVENAKITDGATITGDSDFGIYGGYSDGTGTVSGNTITITGSEVTTNAIFGGGANEGTAEGNTVSIEKSTIDADVVGGIGTGDVKGNTVKLTDVTMAADKAVYGGVSIDGSVTGNNIEIGGTLAAADGSMVDVYAGYSANASAVVTGNTITLLAGADVSKANLIGGNVETAGTETAANTLVIGEGVESNSWSGTVNSISKFSTIKMSNVKWEAGGTVLTIADTKNSDLKDTVIDATQVNFDADNASEVAVGESMTFVAAAEAGADPVEVGGYKFGKYTVGTMYEGTLEGDGTTGKAEIQTQQVATQNDLLADARAVGMAFVNQGTDLISDSLNTLTHDGKYGVKTFAAVYGNRSKYDVNDELKINGWSVIAGVGSEKELQNGDFSWGVFYENGSGNFRTYNEFNNDFFRGDGSMVYNGGGVAARYEQKNGVYTEASLRAGMLKSEMDNVLKDGAGNSYGYDSDTTYYGAHIGVGKVIGLTESSDLDVYGKYFHTYNEGDTVTIGSGNKYEFDSFTSDRLRVGARLTTNKENKFSTYYGLAYEYEFSGDVDMRVGTQKGASRSLQGSSYMAEIGLNYLPSPDSPWSFDLNMRGYAGEREGESFNVQATYSF